MGRGKGKAKCSSFTVSGRLTTDNEIDLGQVCSNRYIKGTLVVVFSFGAIAVVSGNKAQNEADSVIQSSPLLGSIRLLVWEKYSG